MGKLLLFSCCILGISFLLYIVVLDTLPLSSILHSFRSVRRIRFQQLMLCVGVSIFILQFVAVVSSKTLNFCYHSQVVKQDIIIKTEIITFKFKKIKIYNSIIHNS
jgi:hypothetical protein